MPARMLFTLVATAALAVSMVACDDDGDDDPSPTPTSTVAVTPTPQPSPSPAATVDPEATPGPAATLTLEARPQALACDGYTPSVITARVVDAAGQPVEDGTSVNFSVVALGSVDPVMALTSDGVATTQLIALAEQAGVVVNVTSDSAAASIRVDCR